MATKQETFDTVVAHLREQGCRSLSSKGGCVYRGPNGLKCAAGCLVPDEKYDPSMEGKFAYKLNYLWEDLGHDPNLVARLQQIHDEVFPSDWEKGFALCAATFKLDYTEVTYETA